MNFRLFESPILRDLEIGKRNTFTPDWGALG